MAVPAARRGRTRALNDAYLELIGLDYRRRDTPYEASKLLRATMDLTAFVSLIESIAAHD